MSPINILILHYVHVLYVHVYALMSSHSSLVNWCGHWFEYFPNPPLNVLSLVENLLSHHDNHLLQHFVSHNITAQVYAWPLLQTLFSEALSKEEWLKLWDNVLSQPPSFLLMVAAAYISCARSALLKCTTVEDVEVRESFL